MKPSTKKNQREKKTKKPFLFPRTYRPRIPPHRTLRPRRHRPHHRHGLVREAPKRRLPGQHDRVRALSNGDRDVRDLGARRRRVLDHRLEHVRGHDDGLAALAAALHDAGLPEGDLLDGELGAWSWSSFF